MKTLKMINPFKPYNGEISKTLYIVQKILGFFVIYAASSLIAELLIIIVFSMMGINLFGNEMPDSLLVQSAPLYGFFVFTICTILYCRFIEKRSLESMGFIKAKGFFYYVKGIFVGTILLGIMIGLLLLTGLLSYSGYNQNINFVYVFVFLIGYLIQGMAEEVLCRGYLMTSLMNKVSIPIAIFISSFVFAFPHFPTLFDGGVLIGLVGIMNLMLFSIIVSLYMLNDGNIFVSCAIHGIWNFLLGIVCGISVSGGETNSSVLLFKVNNDSILTGGQYGLEASIILTLVLFLFVVLLSNKKKKLLG